MAGSRLSNFGTIFSRVTGLMETGAVTEVPIWYNVYKKYPPKFEPSSERPIPPQDPILEIVYEEDFARAKRYNNPKKSASRGSSEEKPEPHKIDLETITN